MRAKTNLEVKKRLRKLRKSHAGMARTVMAISEKPEKSMYVRPKKMKLRYDPAWSTSTPNVVRKNTVAETNAIMAV